MDRNRSAGMMLCLLLLAAHETCRAVTSVSMWTHAMFEAERGAYIESVKSFNAGNKDVRAELFFGLRRGRYGDQLDAAADEGKLPCVFDVDSANVYRFARAGKLVALDGFPFVEGLKKRMLWTAVQQGSVDGRLYALGQYESILGLWGNRRLLEKAGIRIPSSPRDTWSGGEFESALRKLKERGTAFPLAIRLDDAAPERTAHVLAPLIQSHGGDLVDRSGNHQAEGFLNGAASARALRALQDWARRGYANVSSSADSDFMQARAALSIGDHSVFARYRQALGNELVLIPMPRFGSKTATASRMWGWAISSDCRQPAAAAGVIEHLMSEAEVARISDATGGLPVLPAIFARSKNFGAQGPLKVHFDQLFDGAVRVVPQMPSYPAFAAAFHEAVAAILKGSDVQRELDRAAKKIDKTAR